MTIVFFFVHVECFDYNIVNPEVTEGKKKKRDFF